MSITNIQSMNIYNQTPSHSSAVLPPSGHIYYDGGNTAAACQVFDLCEAIVQNWRLVMKVHFSKTTEFWKHTIHCLADGKSVHRRRQLDWADSDLATEGQCGKPTHQPHGLVTVRRKQLRKDETLVLKWATTRGKKFPNIEISASWKPIRQ